MNTVAKLTQKQIEKTCSGRSGRFSWNTICGWILRFISMEKCFDTHDKETGEFYYNDPETSGCERKTRTQRRYFENVAEDHILSMAFEGTVCHMLWYGTNPGIKKKVRQES